MDSNLIFQLKVIDYYCTFEYLLGYRSNDYIDLNPSSYTPNTTVYCPFHENIETKAAKLYGKDRDSTSEKLYCFAENKLYYPHSLLSPPKDYPNHPQFKSLVPYDPLWVFSAIWNHLPEQYKKYWKTENPDITINNPISNQKEFYSKYRKGELTLFQLLENINRV